VTIRIRCKAKDGNTEMFCQVNLKKNFSFNYDVLAPRGYRFQPNNTHNLLCTTARNVVERIKQQRLELAP
jgi:hypothetical protein